MNFRVLLVSLLIGVFALVGCKKEGSNPVDDTDEMERQLFVSFQALNMANDELIRIGDSLDVSPQQAMFHALPYLKNLDIVEDVYFLDSTYLRITTIGGYKTTLSINAVGVDGLSLYRGSQSGLGKLAAFDGSCKNKIENKKVLLYGAYQEDFYLSSEFQNVVNTIKGGDVEVEVTVLKNEECTLDIIETFDQYGFVILDTHGEIDAVLSGTRFSLNKSAIPGSVDAFLDMLRSKVGSKHFTSFLNKNLNLGYSYKYNPSQQNQQVWDQVKQGLIGQYNVSFTSKGIRELIPDLSNTIVFANCCYSGFKSKSYINGNFSRTWDPVQPAWMSKNPMAFYGYEAANKGVSYKAENEFCKSNEDTLIHALLYHGDSTGSAHLYKNSINEYPWSAFFGWQWNEGPLRFNQYGKDNWCYGVCGEKLTDKRDGHVYETVCIGGQIWMAENLNWAGAGICYDNVGGNCDIYGRLYSIFELVNNQTSINGDIIQGLCPEGWHVPSSSEYQTLINNVGGEYNAMVELPVLTWGATPPLPTNEHGFSLLPAQTAWTDGNNGGTVKFWTLPSNKLGQTKLWTSTGNGIVAGVESYDYVDATTTTSVSRYFKIRSTGQDPAFADYMYCRCIKDKP